MSITVSEKTGKQVPPGTHLAVCYRIVDLGTQPDTGFGQKEKLVLFFELPHERDTFDGREMPMGISKFYTKSLGKRASLRKDLESWRGRPFTAVELEKFDLAAILGKGCQLQVIDDKGRSKVSAVVGLPKGTTTPPPFNPIMEFSVSEGKDSPKFAMLPDWVKSMASECIEWDDSAAPATSMPTSAAGAPAVDDSSEIPF